MSTCSLQQTPDGAFQFVQPNRVTAPRADFYVSYNATDRAQYGCVTTAVVLGQMQRFYVLSGDHERALAGKPFAECLDYLHDHAADLHRYSETLPPRGSTVAQILSSPRYAAKPVPGAASPVSLQP